MASVGFFNDCPPITFPPLPPIVQRHEHWAIKMRVYPSFLRIVRQQADLMANEVSPKVSLPTSPLPPPWGSFPLSPPPCPPPPTSPCCPPPTPRGRPPSPPTSWWGETWSTPEPPSTRRTPSTSPRPLLTLRTWRRTWWCPPCPRTSSAPCQAASPSCPPPPSTRWPSLRSRGDSLLQSVSTLPSLAEFSEGRILFHTFLYLLFLCFPFHCSSWNLVTIDLWWSSCMSISTWGYTTIVQSPPTTSPKQPLLLPTWSSLIIAIKTLTRTQCQIFSCELKLLGDAKNLERKANSLYLTGSNPVVWSLIPCRAKSKDGGKVLRDKLERIGMELPSGFCFRCCCDFYYFCCGFCCCCCCCCCRCCCVSCC